MGHVGTPQQGAVGLGSMIAWLMGTVFVGCMTVGNTLVAQDYGAQNHQRIRRHIHTGFVLTPFFTICIWALLPLLPLVVGTVGTSEAVQPYVIVYVSIRLLAAPLLLTNFNITGFLRGLGDMHTPMAITIISNIINAPLSIVLVFGLFGLPKMGVAGAAWGSFISACIETLLYLAVYFGPKYNRLYGTRRLGLPAWREVAKFLRIGLPIGFSWMFDMTAWTAFSVYASTLQPEALAAHIAIFQMMHFSFMPAAAISIAGTTLVGQYIGAKRIDLAERSARRSIAVIVGYMGTIGTLMIALRYPLITAFNPDPKVVGIGMTIIIIAGVFQPFDGVWMAVGGVLRGAGDTRFPMIAMAICGAVVFIPGVYLLGEVFSMGIVGAWLAALTHTVVFAIVIGARYRFGPWRKMSVV